VGECFVVLKDVHSYLTESTVAARLKSIAERTLYQDGVQATIFLVCARLVIPYELEKLITVFEIPLPSQAQIASLIRRYGNRQGVTIESAVVNKLALSFKGLDEFDILQILNLAYQSHGQIDSSDYELILWEKEQIIKKSGMLELIGSRETMDDVGGLDNLKQWLSLKGDIFHQLDQAVEFGVDIPKGILILGMPGCGKSLSAKATARLLSVPLLRLDVGKLLGKYVGESEENMRRALRAAEAVSPCVLWVDELEKAFAGIGQSDGHEVTTRLFGYFLTWLQEKESAVFVVATANDISRVPPEFLRKGRFDELFYVDFPNVEERRRIFEVHLNKRGRWHRGIDTIRLAQETDGFNGADIESVVKRAVEASFLRGEKTICTENLLEARRETTPMSVSIRDKIQEMKKTLSRFEFRQASKEGETGTPTVTSHPTMVVVNEKSPNLLLSPGGIVDTQRSAARI